MGNNDLSCGDGGWTPDSQIDEYRGRTPLDEKVSVAGTFVSAICKGAEEYEQVLFMLAAEESIRRSGSMNFDEWIGDFFERIGGVAKDAWEYCKN